MKTSISRAYFENYAGRHLPYNKVWKDHSYYDECCNLFSIKDAPPIKSLCVLGASTGLVLKEFDRRLGLKAFGCEINSWAHAQIPSEYRRRIRRENMIRYIHIKHKAQRRFDLIFANSLQYLPEEKLKPFLKKLSKVGSFLHFRSSVKEDYCPDEFRRTLKSYVWWNKIITESGFEPFLWGPKRNYCWKSVSLR